MQTDTITIEKTFTAAAEDVWRAWAEPGKVLQWFGSDPGGKGISARMDVQPGGEYEITFANADGERHTCFGVYMEVRPFYRLSFTWAWKAEPGVESLVTVAVEPMGDFTTMHFTHAKVGFASAHNYRQGWSDTFLKLEELLDGRR